MRRIDTEKDLDFSLAFTAIDNCGFLEHKADAFKEFEESGDILLCVTREELETLSNALLVIGALRKGNEKTSELNDQISRILGDFYLKG